ncbi:hypothetical protein [Xanthomonas sp. GPE 39]|uniref:hypothetical protein n=1 Tax=Xanthomonas sp. GPE 39 TaxID=1583099 RepID=UPI001269F68B|nr:hypothetical protein [Xanthomonas sp. GPE 39]
MALSGNAHPAQPLYRDSVRRVCAQSRAELYATSRQGDELKCIPILPRTLAFAHRPIHRMFAGDGKQSLQAIMPPAHLRTAASNFIAALITPTRRMNM